MRRQSVQKHTGPVWQVRWVMRESVSRKPKTTFRDPNAERADTDDDKDKDKEKEKEGKSKPHTATGEQSPAQAHPSGESRGEILVSLSTDGRVSTWSLKKGFECSGTDNPLLSSLLDCTLTLNSTVNTEL